MAPNATQALVWKNTQARAALSYRLKRSQSLRTECAWIGTAKDNAGNIGWRSKTSLQSFGLAYPRISVTTRAGN